MNGRTATNEEIALLSERFRDFTWLKDFLVILKTYKIIGMQFRLNEDEDSSGAGVRMRWMTPKCQVEESFELFPGIIVREFGFLPIGECLRGSGDPYFLKEDGGRLKLFRVLHDYSSNFTENMVEYVSSLESVLKNN